MERNPNLRSKMTKAKWLIIYTFIDFVLVSCGEARAS